MPTKFSYNEVKKIFQEKGYKLISKIYENVRKKLQYECSCGYDNCFASIDSIKAGNISCIKCSSNPRYSYEDVKNLFKEKGYKLLSKTYKGNKSNLNYECLCGENCFTTLESLNTGRQSCLKCVGSNRRVKYTFDEVKKLFKEKGYKLLSKKYIGSKENLNYECSCGNENCITTLDSLVKDHISCKKCIKILKESIFMERYGVKYFMQNKEFSKRAVEKRKENCMKKYGVEHAIQNKEIYDRYIKSVYLFKEYILPSGKKIKYQGYEKFCLKYLLEELNITEKDILEGYNNMPEIWYYDKDYKKHRYYPDIYIPSKNWIIEIKSIFTYKVHEDKNLLKMEACKDAGYKTNLMIYNDKGDRLKNYSFK
jgi:hypothetical protein